jgi:hypothetical protein
MLPLTSTDTDDRSQTNGRGGSEDDDSLPSGQTPAQSKRKAQNRAAYVQPQSLPAPDITGCVLFRACVRTSLPFSFAIRPLHGWCG